jgi:hypothetical protein
MTEIRSIETATIHQLGKLGEVLPENDKFEEIIYLNSIKPNFPVFDYLIKINGVFNAVSIKARRKYGKNGKLNTVYNILTGSNKRSRKFNKALALLESNGYDVSQIKYGFIFPKARKIHDLQSCI